MATGNGGEFRPAEQPGETLAPVIPLFGGRSVERPARPAPAASPDAQPSALHPSGSEAASDSAGWHPTWLEDEAPEDRAGDDGSEDDSDADDLAEKRLLRKLRARSLSVAEARKVLTQSDVPPDRAESIIDGFVRHGYLDDAALAEQLVHVGVDRKGQGRQVIAQTLSGRGVPRDVADAALSALPDDEAERALEFARSRASRLGDVDDTTAMRRLLGQLMRRGYGGSAATNAARTALAERGTGSYGVRFR